jgi:uncharacterized protein YcfJ
MVSVTRCVSVGGGAGEKRAGAAGATGVGVAGADAGGGVLTAQETEKMSRRVIANLRIDSKLLDSASYDMLRNHGMQAIKRRVEQRYGNGSRKRQLTVAAARVE